MVAPTLRDQGDAPQPGDLRPFSFACDESEYAAHGSFSGSNLRVVLGRQAAELVLDLFLRDHVADPAVLVSAVDAGVPGAPCEVAHQAFGFALAFAGLEPIEKSGDILSLAKEYIRLVGEFKGIEGFDKAIKRYEDGLDKDPWRKEVLTGKNYLSYLEVLKKYKSASAVKKLDQFVADNAGSIYGKWTAAVVKEFKADGTISVSAAGKPFGER